MLLNKAIGKFIYNTAFSIIENTGHYCYCFSSKLQLGEMNRSHVLRTFMLLFHCANLERVHLEKWACVFIHGKIGLKSLANAGGGRGFLHTDHCQ